MRRFLSVSVLSGLALSAVATSSVLAQTTAVNNYNYLQLPTNEITPFIGGGAGGGNGYGTPTDFRWGDHVWIPDGTLTNNGAGDYFAGVKFDANRLVENVQVQWWANEGTSIKQFFLQGSLNGSQWTDIGSHNYGSFQTGTGQGGAPLLINVDTTDGTYGYIRVLVKTGDYTFGNAARGGPGLYAIEPQGDSTLLQHQVNIANVQFGTTVANNDLGFNATRYNDGFLFDDEAQRTGNNPGNWDPGDYAQINLGGLKTLNDAVVVWDYVWEGSNLTIQYSTDGVNFFNVPNQSGPVNFGANGGASEYRFDPVTAQAIRITNVTGGQSYHLLNQVLLYNLPEPTGVAGVLLGGVGLLVRRNRARR